jgi:hypothetical protein
MRFWPRLRGLLLSPRATWQAIAAEPAPSLARAIPLLLLPWLLLVLATALMGEPVLPHRQANALMKQRPDGAMVQIGTQTVTRAGSLAVGLGGVAFTLAWLFLMQRMILDSAARYLAVPDRAAARKLVLHAPCSLWLALYLVPVGLAIFLPLALVHTIVLARLGAPILLPPHPGQEAGFGRSVAFRAALLALAVAGAAIAAVVWVVNISLG